MPQIFDPLKDYKPMVLDALNIGLMIRRSSQRKIREAVMAFVHKYGLLGLMTALPTTPKFVDYRAVYLPVNHFIREEVMDTNKYLDLFFLFRNQISKRRARTLPGLLAMTALCWPWRSRSGKNRKPRSCTSCEITQSGMTG